MTGLLDNLWGSIEEEQTAVIALRTMPLVHVDNDAEQIEQELQRLDLSLNNLNDQYTNLAEGATSNNIGRTENFEQWLDVVVKMQRELQSVHETIQQLREPPEVPSFSPDEQLVLTALTQFGINANLIRVRQALNTVNDDTFWSIVRALWERQIIEVNLKTQ